MHSSRRHPCGRKLPRADSNTELYVPSGAEAARDPTVARLLERMSSFRVMDIIFVLRDSRAILDELNELFQFRIPTYSRIRMYLERAKRNLRW